ncbi:dioxygenase [Desulfuromonas versatilis]|uniref:Dioxygenase n=1 Tax=Desulfuromonas versatilis TaxID=2802975 RepID=A0ABM8HWF3_9BACT|nr:VOC family protein [Desulfuromonas versatilis]BCR05041.1 dioxygenase [Desulfuromonas versatilis]
MECLMDHIVLNVTDMDAMLEFYTGILEMPAERLSAFRAGEVPFPSVRLNADTIIDLFPEALWKNTAVPGPCGAHLNHFCLGMSREAWEGLRERLEKAATPIEAGPVKRWGAHGTGISLYFRDPENNLIEARYYAVADDHRSCRLGS